MPDTKPTNRATAGLSGGVSQSAMDAASTTPINASESPPITSRLRFAQPRMALGIAPTSRAEDLAVDTYVAIANYLSAEKG